MRDPAEFLQLWTVYENPLDYPGKFVARLYLVGRGVHWPTEQFVAGDTLEEVREQLPPGLYCLARDPSDEPHIVEVWL